MRKERPEVSVQLASLTCVRCQMAAPIPYCQPLLWFLMLVVAAPEPSQPLTGSGWP